MTLQRYFEDIVVGETSNFGRYEMTAAEIIEFARKYDPQPFHTDPEAAKATSFGGLIASGWHTCGAFMNMMVHNSLAGAGLGSPGVDELRWLKPVRPGDILSVRGTVLEKRESKSRPDRGIVRSSCEILNQHGEVMMTMITLGFIRRRPT
ncbi:MAG: MaoC family dehydratase [Alphaproteobacteria bacterium]|nr:MaoC family dehydratase [Alphaproteobacteria bacterium]